MLKLNYIVILENKEEYILLEKVVYQGKNYFLAMGLNKNREVISTNVVIFEECIKRLDTYVRKITDTELIKVLTDLFKTKK